MRDTISVRGARENNLQNINIEIPRNKLVVVTGLSGSGKSSLAFETVYAEGQRRSLESMSTYAKRFVAQLKKPDVDFVDGLSPVVSIEQKTVTMNPRSTVGTMTDLYDYLRMLYATIGISHCPYCGVEVPIRTPYQMMEHLLSMPEGTEIELYAPVFKIYGKIIPTSLMIYARRGAAGFGSTANCTTSVKKSNWTKVRNTIFKSSSTSLLSSLILINRSLLPLTTLCSLAKDL